MTVIMWGMETQDACPLNQQPSIPGASISLIFTRATLAALFFLPCFSSAVARVR
jgi:hypothetical protein